MIPLIYNPASGGGRGALRWRKAEGMLGLADVVVRAIPTTRPGHAAELAADLGVDHDLILVMGGDGTISEAANGLLDVGATTTLGCLPTGTGNDFLRDFGILDLPGAIERIQNGKPRRVDAIKITHDDGTRWSINVFGTGFVSRAAALCNRRYKWLGSRCYTAAVLSEITRLKNVETKVWLDDEELTWTTPFVSVCNSAYTGGKMHIAPHADPADGKMDIMRLDPVGKTELLRVFPKIFDGSHVQHPKVHFTTGTKLRIEPTEPSPLLADGEVFGSTPVTLELVPGALSVLQ